VAQSSPLRLFLVPESFVPDGPSLYWPLLGIIKLDGLFLSCAQTDARA